MVDQENPWPGLASFTEDSRSFFFGREQETEELVRLIRRHTLTVLFGQSGLGKSSLLQAGAFPVLREQDFLPLYLRLDHGPEAPALADQVKTALLTAYENAKADAPAPRPEESLWEYFHRKNIDIWSAKNRLLTPVLAFDQFEEIFTLGRTDEARRDRSRAFLTELADLVENRPPAALRARFESGELNATAYAFDKPSCQVVFSLREDFLPELESLKQEMRSILQNRMRVRRLNGTQALEIVTRPAPALLADGVKERIVEFVAGARGGSAERLTELEVEPALLSVICRELNERRKQLGQAQITVDLVSGNRREILTDFYERSVTDLPEGMRTFVEDHLLTKSGFRDNFALETALEFPAVTRPLIDTLVSRRLIRLEDRGGIQRVELTHDVLAEVIRVSRDSRQQRLAEEKTRGQERANRRRMRLTRAIAAGLLVGLAGVSWIAWRAVHAEKQQARLRASAEFHEQKSQRLAYASDINALQGALDKDNLGRARVLLDRQRPAAGASDLRGWEWRYLWQFCQSGAQKILKAPTPDEVSAISVSADGAWAAVGTREKGQLSLHHLKTGEKLELPMPAGSHCRAVFSPTEPLLAFGGRPLNMGTTTSPAMAPEARVVQIWDLQQRRVIRSLPITGACAGLAFSADGRTLVIGDAAADNQGEISRWRVVDGAKLSTIPTAISAAAYAQAFALTPDASTVAFGSPLSTTSNQNEIRVVDLTSGQLKWQQTISENFIMCLAFSPDGQRLASGAGAADSKIYLWETASGREIGRLEGQRGWTGGVQFLADGKHLLSGSADQVIRLWDLETRTIVRAFRGHQSEVRTFAISPDQQSFVSGCKDGSAYLWNLNEDRAAATHGKISSGPSAENKYGAWTFSADSRALVTLANDGRLTRWEGRNFDQPTPLLPLDVGRKGPDDLEFVGNNAGARNQVFDGARPRLALVTPAGQVQVWDWALRQRVREWPANADQGQASVSRFSADGQTLVLSTFHPTTRASHYREWAIATGQETRALALPPPKPGSRRSLAHAPGANELLLINRGDTESMRYDFAAARFIPTTSLHLQQLSGRPSFSIDGRYLFAASASGEVRVFDATTLQETAKLRGFMFGAHSVAFAPDGQRLVTGSTAQESITIWDQGNFERLLTFPTTDSGFGSAGFSPDGNVLVGRSSAGNIFFWRAPTFEEIAQADARSAKLEGVAP